MCTSGDTAGPDEDHQADVGSSSTGKVQPSFVHVINTHLQAKYSAGDNTEEVRRDQVSSKQL